MSGIDNPIGVSSYELTRALPASIKSALPTVEEIEAELAVAEPLQPEPKACRRRTPKRKPTKKKPKPPRSKGET